MIGSARLYTWLDVEEVVIATLKGQPWPSWLRGVRAYWDSLTLLIEAGNQVLAWEWVKEIFDPRIISKAGSSNQADLLIALEHSDGLDRTLPVMLEASEQALPERAPTPTLRRPGILQPTSFQALQPPALEADSPRLFAFHSFKGGVGRTMHAMALVLAIAKSNRSVLLVDGDFEAPGITWMVESRLPDPPISFADLIALAHGDTSRDLAETVGLATIRLRDAFLDGVFVLPAFRPSQTFTALEVRPEHLVDSHSSPFVLTKLLVDVGRALGVAAIVTDLRAGLSELSAGLLLDPRIQRVLVTTLSGQAIHGTLAVLDLLSNRAPSQRDDDPSPNVIISQVPTELIHSGVFRSVEEEIFKALLKTICAPIDGSDLAKSPSDLVKGPTPFDTVLMVTPKSWDETVGALNRSRTLDTVQSYVQDLPAILTKPNVTPSPAPNVREKLINTAKDLVYAESSGGRDFLPTSALRKLATDHKTQVPITVVIGAKGAGKTYTFLQLIERVYWPEFVKKASSANTPAVSAIMAPVLGATNLKENAAQLLLKAKERIAEIVGNHKALSDPEVRDGLREQLKQDSHEGRWREHWLNAMAWSAGYNPGSSTAGREFIEHLKSTNKQVVSVIDGLEDLFQNLPTNAQEQAALRSLLQDVPGWLAQQPDRPLGLIAFVRRDMVLNAVKQNAGQLMARYEPYSLRWDKVEALRLVLWVCVEAGCLALSSSQVLTELSESELVEALLPLWGRKLGPDRSREGRSAEWVIAALSDFRGQIQARDLVRFLYLAAQHSAANPEGSTDRILVPIGIRNAVADCSKEKIDEILQENPRLGEVLTQLRSLPAEKRSIPFQQQNIGLTSEQISILDANGVVIAEKGDYYMPEIFRRGLEFILPQGARPKVLALARRRS